MKLKLEVHQLAKGMYVSELDRDWLESPFLFQGFEIQTDDELAQLTDLCEFVYIDPERSSFDVSANLQSLAAQLPESRKPVLRKKVSPDPEDSGEDFKAELVRARRIYNDTHRYIVKALDDVRLGSAVDTETARGLVSEMADSVVRNRNAMVWLTSLKERDTYTVTHCMNVCILALSFGRCLGLPEEQQQEMGLGALLHDLGKMKIPDEVLNKPGRLTDKEFDIIKQHPVLGYRLLAESGDLSPEALDVVLHHHERIDGKGYPSGLTEAEIQYITQIVAIVDVYDAITSDRVYHDGIPPHTALKNMYNWSKNNFDKVLMEEFIRCIGIYPIGSVVKLSSGQVGVVVSANPKSRLRPTILMLFDENRQPYKLSRYVNLASSADQKLDNAVSISGIVDPTEYGISIRAIIEKESSA